MADDSLRPSDFDGAWKEALDGYFDWFVDFFAPDAQTDFDWTRDYESLDTELQKLRPANEVGKRRVDRLVKVWTTSEEVEYLHVEVQGQPEEEFEGRVFTYSYRIRDAYHQLPVTLVILADDQPQWRPTAYEEVRRGVRIRLDFRMVKLLDYWEQRERLLSSANPFALLVLAQLVTRRTRADLEEHRQWKVRLLHRLYEQNLEKLDVVRWCTILDRILVLPDALEKQVWHEVSQREQEKAMEYVASFERLAREEGLEKGRREILLESIAWTLEAKFGAAGVQLFPDFERLADVDTLHALFRLLKTAQTLDEVRQRLGASGADGTAPTLP